MEKKILNFIEEVERNIRQSEKDFKEMSQRNKMFGKEIRERMKIREEEFNKKRASRSRFFD